MQWQTASLVWAHGHWGGAMLVSVRICTISALFLQTLQSSLVLGTKDEHPNYSSYLRVTH